MRRFLAVAFCLFVLPKPCSAEEQFTVLYEPETGEVQFGFEGFTPLFMPVIILESASGQLRVAAEIDDALDPDHGDKPFSFRYFGRSSVENRRYDGGLAVEPGTPAADLSAYMIYVCCTGPFPRWDAQIEVVPEPATAALLVVAAASISARRRKNAA